MSAPAGARVIARIFLSFVLFSPSLSLLLHAARTVSSESNHTHSKAKDARQNRCLRLRWTRSSDGNKDLGTKGRKKKEKKKKGFLSISSRSSGSYRSERLNSPPRLPRSNLFLPLATWISDIPSSSAAINSHNTRGIEDISFRLSIFVLPFIHCLRPWPRSLTPTPLSGTPLTYQAVRGRVTPGHHPSCLRAYFRAQSPSPHIFQTHSHLPLPQTQTCQMMMMPQSSQ